MKNFAVIFGGETSEYEIALKSAYAFISNMPNDIKPLLLPIDKNGNMYLFEGQLDDIKNDSWKERSNKIIFSPNKSDHGFYLNAQLIKVDSAIIIIHGKNGEDGTIQGLLKLAGIPFVGSDILGSALCMDKYLSHKVAESIGIKVAKSILLNKESVIEKIDLKYPLFVKPLKAGSSIGITKINEEKYLMSAIDNAFKYDDEVIIEEEIKGVEVGVAILENKETIIGEVDEIEMSHDFFDYEDKYMSDTSKVYLPARFSIEKRQEIKDTANKLFHILKCRHFARIDMFIDENQDIYFNEINTIPGLTDHSRLPNMLNAIGMNFKDIVSYLVHIYD